ncbi:hypothetical protein [Streptomyces natalensis]|uniref:Uncharacterized protein n=1 Tax=Streptomyces natalensis ATCC 27448 TaxID=1240678 RepID=A0A0D7CLQ5_9ACTN|nr:hypothetical protein [Streptomyces natalensis]KIZ17021.1 hypothetical protein SNA_18935 [Streptomyces natalensis ATCC 27448]
MSTTTRDEVIAIEQKAVDHAYECYGARLAEMSGTSAATASAAALGAGPLDARLATARELYDRADTGPTAVTLLGLLATATPPPPAGSSTKITGSRRAPADWPPCTPTGSAPPRPPLHRQLAHRAPRRQPGPPLTTTPPRA